MSELLICRYPLCPVRTAPADPSEMSTQIFFGEIVEKLNQKDQWLEIRNLTDGYQGWVDEKFFVSISDNESTFWNQQTQPVFNESIIVQGPEGEMALTRGTRLPKSPIKEFSFNGHEYLIKGGLATVPESRIKLAQAYLNAPYLWGGKSILGIDCSGFTQMLMQFEGKNFPRDAYQQAEIGEMVEFDERKMGDFAYFHNSKGKITHVGLLVSPDEIMHAHGCVRIDDFTQSGIINREKKNCSHTLSFLRRC